MDRADDVIKPTSGCEAETDPRGVAQRCVSCDRAKPGHFDLEPKLGAFTIRELDLDDLWADHPYRRLSHVGVRIKLDRKRNMPKPMLELGGSDLDLVESDGLIRLECVSEDRSVSAVDDRRHARQMRGATYLDAVEQGDSSPVGCAPDDQLLVCCGQRVGPGANTFTDELVAEIADHIEPRLAVRDRERTRELDVGISGGPPESSARVGFDHAIPLW